VLASGFLASGASAQVRAVTYNLAKLAGDGPSIRGVLSAIAADNKPGFAIAPAVLCFQEIRNADVAALDSHVAAAFPGIPYARGTYTTSGTEDGAAGAQCMYYRTDLLTEIASAHADIPTGASRNSDRWLLALNGYSSPQARFYVYSSHLKASNTASDAAIREDGALALRANANALGAGQHAIFVGDYNLYTNTEPAYQAMVAAGNAQCVDPIGATNWTGAANALKHTQSPRSASGALVGGGVDDRFDFIFSTNEFHDNDGLAYIAGSYRTFGNDGNHFDLAINAGNNTYYPSNIALSNQIADFLHDATDHMPVVCDFKVPAVLAATVPASFGTVIAGAAVPVVAEVSNVADVVHPLGAAAATVTVTGSGRLVGSGGGTAPLAPLPPLETDLFVNTAVVGPASGTVTVTTAAEGAQNASIVRTVTGTVLAHATASFSAAKPRTATTVTAEVAAHTAPIELTAAVHNLDADAFTARLDVDGATGLTAPFSVIDAVETGIHGTPATLRFGFDPAGLAAGTYTQTATIATSDEDLPGATSGALSLTLSVTVTATGHPADLDHDGTVGGSDLAILLSQWGSAGSADFDGSGTVGGSDLATLLGAWGS
jgi:hypothetical protein